MGSDDSSTGRGTAAGGEAPSGIRKTLIFANDKSSGKTTTANAVLVSLLDRYPGQMRSVTVREYERQPRLATIFATQDGLGAISHHDARNAQAVEQARNLAHDPNATPWDDLLYALGSGGLIVDLGANIFTEVCRILDDEPRPIFPDDGEMMGVVVPVTTAEDSVESAITAIEAAASWGPKTRIFAAEQEYLGSFSGVGGAWPAFRDRMLQTQGSRFSVVRVGKLMVADIGSVVFQRIDRLVPKARAALLDTKLYGAEYIRAVRKARSEVSWGGRTLEAVKPIADWFAH